MSEIREFPIEFFELDRYGDKGHFSQPYGSPIVLTLDTGRGYSKRFKMGGWTAEGEGRTVQDGPMVKGPHAYTFGLATVISAHPQAPELEFPVKDGDVLKIVGTLYRVRVVRREWIELDRVED